MTAEAGIELGLSASVVAGVGQAVADAIAADRARLRPGVPPDVCFPAQQFINLSTGQPALGNSVGPLQGWCWQLLRAQIIGAVAGSYTLYDDLGAAQNNAPQEQLPLPSGTAPNQFWEPRGKFLRYGQKMTAVGSGVTTAGILVVEFVSIREDWLATYLM
jgi:hypothetical protein